MLRMIRLISIQNKAQRNYGSDRNSKTYYEILRLPQDASKKDIRSAFIKLSKEAHPDTSSRSIKSSHEEFVKINEAYNILSKDHSREQYDIQLKYGSNSHSAKFRQPDRTYYHYHDPTWNGARRRRSHKKTHDEYYRNANPNFNFHFPIVTWCFLLLFIGGATQIAAVWFKSRNHYERAMRDSKRYNNDYSHIRARAQLLGTQGILANLDDSIIGDDINDKEVENERDEDNVRSIYE